MGKTSCAPILGIDRLRMGTDGKGITSLVTFYGCPLYCKYCLNPQCHNNLADVPYRNPQEVYDAVSVDELYYLATGGGVTFGGGEPLLYADFIIDVLKLGAKNWNITIESSLNVPHKQIEKLLPYINSIIVDVKDMNPQIYKAYTRTSNAIVIKNLKELAAIGFSNNVLVRIPLIKGYNTNDDNRASKRFLEDLGYTSFDLFEYNTSFNHDWER